MLVFELVSFIFVDLSKSKIYVIVYSSITNYYSLDNLLKNYINEKDLSFIYNLLPLLKVKKNIQISF